MHEEGLLEVASGYFSGASRYLDALTGLREVYPRIYVQCRIPGVSPPFLALLDTGAHFCILNRDVAELVQPHLTDGLGQVTVRTAHGPVAGELFSHQVSLVAGFGESLDIEANVFVPPNWRGPSFIGYAGALDRVRFAVDPRKNRFYFGSLF